MNNENEKPSARELLPCPFCGCEKTATCFVPNTSGNVQYHCCPKCSAQGPWGHASTINEKWNRRTTPPTQSQVGTPEVEWVIEEFGNKLWVGPMRRDGKLNEVVCIFDLEDLKPRAESRKRQLANIIVQCVNNAGPQSNAIRNAENERNAAQRDNARLAGEVAELKADKDLLNLLEKSATIRWPIVADHRNIAAIAFGVEAAEPFTERPTVRAILRANIQEVAESTALKIAALRAVLEGEG